MRWLGLIALAACGGSPELDVQRCWEYKLPAGWVAREGTTGGVDLVLAGPEKYKVGSAVVSPEVTVAFIGGDLPLDAFQRALQDAANDPQLGVRSVSATTITPIELDGFPGFRMDMLGTLTIGGGVVQRSNSTLAVKVGRTIVQITGGYATDRKDRDQASSDAILASVRFAKCAAK